MKKYDPEWWASLPPERVGKETENIVENFFKEWNKEQHFAWHPVPDSRGSRGMVRAQPADYTWRCGEKAGFLELKGTDSVEFQDINFSNIIHFDDVGLFKIPEYTKVDTTIVGNYCVILDSIVNEIPIYHTLNGDTIHDRICIETLGKHTVRSFVKGCDKIIKEINIDIINCNSALVCSNVTLRKNE